MLTSEFVVLAKYKYFRVNMTLLDLYITFNLVLKSNMKSKILLMNFVSKLVGNLYILTDREVNKHLNIRLYLIAIIINTFFF